MISMASDALEAARLATEAANEAVAKANSANEAAQLAMSQAQMIVGDNMVDPFVFRLAIFVLAIFVGYYVVWSVTPALHTPLMSVTNAISSVIVVGALLALCVEIGEGATWTAKIFGFFALILASVNIFGGFLVSQRMRMLAMYKKKEG